LIAAPLAILLLGCLHEDMAILAAGYFVVERGLSPWLAGGYAFGGLLVNNLLLYYLGMRLRDHTWMRRWLLNKHAPIIRRRLERHLVTTLTLARFGHSMLMPALVGCGSLRIPIQRVLPIIALTGVVYVAVLLTTVIILGAAVMRDLGNLAWLVPVALALGLAAYILRRRFARQRA
jgi:membrane protein DedA with SNARE-associated domain